MESQIVNNFKRWRVDQIQYEQRGEIWRIKFHWTNGQQNTIWTKRSNMKSKKPIEISRYKQSSGISNKLGETSNWVKKTKDKEFIKRLIVSRRDSFLRKCNKNERHYGQDCTEIGKDK